MHSRDAKPGKPNWLLIKEKDEFANDEQSPVVTETQPDSAVTKRSIEQIAKDNDRTWRVTGLQMTSRKPFPSRMPQSNLQSGKSFVSDR